MDSSVFKKAVRVSSFVVLLALSIGSVFYFSSAEFLRNVLFPTWFFKDLPGIEAYRPEISVICPPTAYALETVRLTITVRSSRALPSHSLALYLWDSQLLRAEPNLAPSNIRIVSGILRRVSFVYCQCILS